MNQNALINWFCFKIWINLIFIYDIKLATIKCAAHTNENKSQ